MKTLHLYLTRQVLLTLLMTVMVFTFVLLLANILKEILSLLVNRQVTMLLAGEAVGLLIPFVLVFALPMGMLTAALLVFGRFSADHELTAARASGVSLLSLVTPVLVLSCALSIVCAMVNLYIAPQCRVAYKKLLYEVGVQQASMFLVEETFIKDFKDHIVYVGTVKGSNLQDILIYNLQNDKVDSYIKASSGRINIDVTNQVIRLQLMDAWSIRLSEGKRIPPVYATESELTYTNKPPTERQEKVKLTDMTFTQLNAQLKELERRISAPPVTRNMSRVAMAMLRRDMERQRADMTLPVKMQIHRQVSFSFACIAFTLVGIPLGIRAHRRETTFGIAVALMLVAVYYSFFIFGQALDTHPEWAPYLILWVPNFLFQAVGAVLLWRANRGI